MAAVSLLSPEVQMMGLILPLFVSALSDPASSLSGDQKRLHDHILTRIMAIGPRYQAPFKAIMLGSPALKQRLEAAIRAGQSPSKAAAPQARLRAQPQQAPAIKLKMDFSNFK